MVSCQSMTGEQDVRKEQDLQLFSKRIDQLIRHKNHIIDILQEELEKGRKDVPETLEQQLKQLEAENASLRARLAAPPPSPLPPPLPPPPTITPETEQRLLKEIETTRNELERAHREQEITRSEIERILRDIANTQSELERARQAEAAARQENLETAHSAEVLRAENAGLKSQLAQLEQCLRDQEALVVQASKPSTEQRRLEAELLAVRRESETLLEQVTNLQQQLLEKEREIRSIPAVRAQAQAETARVQADLAEALREIDRLRGLFEQNRQEEERQAQNLDELKRMRESAALTDEEIRRLKQRIHDAHQQQLGLQEEIQRLHEESDGLKLVVAEKTASLEHFDQEIRDLLAEQSRVQTLLEEHQGLAAQFQSMREALHESREREARLVRESEELQVRVRNQEERFRLILLPQEQTIDYRPEEAPAGEESAEKPFSESTPLAIHLPFLFPERHLSPMRIAWKPSANYHLKPAPSASKPVFRISRPMRFFRIFRDTPLEAPVTLGGRLANFPVAALGPVAMVREAGILPTLPPKKIIPPMFPVIGMAMSALRPHALPLPAPAAIKLTRRRFTRGSYVWLMQLELLAYNLHKTLQEQLHHLEPNTRTMIIRKRDQSALISALSQKVGKLPMPAPAVPAVVRIAPVRTLFEPAVPRGRLGMLMKGLEESLQSLNSRLDIGAHPPKQ